jgi:hypothetical protein
MQHSRILRLALLPFLALLGTGCSGRYLKSLDTKYEHTRLPAHFDKNLDQDDHYASVGVSRSEQQTVAFDASDSVPYSFRNAGTSVEGSILMEHEALHFGAQIGFSPGEEGLIRLGGFGGASVTVFNRLVTSASGGVFLNNNQNRAHYEDLEWVWFFPTSVADSTEGTEGHLEIPLRANILFDTHTPVSPYLSVSANIVGIGISDAGETMLVSGLTAGALVDLPGGHGFRFEGSTVSQEMAGKQGAMDDAQGKALWSGRVEYVKKI